MSRVGVYAGSFDPVTNGHSDLVARSFAFVDHLVVGVATNVNKQALFTMEERAEFIRHAVGEDERIEVRAFQGLLVEFARSLGARIIIRGLRAVSDFEYEFQMALMNRQLAPEIETIFMLPSVETTYLSSSLVREVARHGGAVDQFAHPRVVEALRAKFRSA